MYAAKTQKIPKRPNILIITGDDIGWSNLSAHNLGMMGCHAPNIGLTQVDFESIR
jgi:arylsulfatase A-like enzyme